MRSQFINIYTHTQTKSQRQIKVYLLKIPFKFSEIFTSNILAFSVGTGCALRNEGTLAQVPPSAFSNSPLIIANLRICELRKESHSEGDAGRSLLWFRTAQRTSHKTTVYRITR